MENLSVFIAGLIIGMYSFWLIESYFKIKNDKDLQKKFEAPFRDILNNLNLIFFNRRIGHFIYIDYKLSNLDPKISNDYIILINIESRGVYLMQNDQCITATTYIKNNEFCNNLYTSLVKKFKKEIADVVIIDNNPVSRKLAMQGLMGLQESVIEKTKEKSELTIDEVLDRINQVGVENLSKEEKEFLKNIK